MGTTHSITATEAARGFSDLLHRVHYLHESFIITKGNRPMAYITPSNEVVKPVTLKDLVKRAKKMGYRKDDADDKEYYEALREIRSLPPQFRYEEE